MLIKYFIVFSFVLSFSAPVFAQNDLQQCITEHTQCTNRCLEKDSVGAQAACVATCAGVQATCAGQVGLADSQPFVEEKAGQLEQFLYNWLGDFVPWLNDSGQSVPNPGTDT